MLCYTHIVYAITVQYNDKYISKSFPLEPHLSEIHETTEYLELFLRNSWRTATGLVFRCFQRLYKILPLFKCFSSACCRVCIRVV